MSSGWWVITAWRLGTVHEFSGTQAARRNSGSGHEKASDAGLGLLLWGRTTACDPHALGQRGPDLRHVTCDGLFHRTMVTLRDQWVCGVVVAVASSSIHHFHHHHHHQRNSQQQRHQPQHESQTECLNLSKHQRAIPSAGPGRTSNRDPWCVMLKPLGASAKHSRYHGWVMSASSVSTSSITFS